MIWHSQFLEKSSRNMSQTTSNLLWPGRSRAHCQHSDVTSDGKNWLVSAGKIKKSHDLHASGWFPVSRCSLQLIHGFLDFPHRVLWCLMCMMGLRSPMELEHTFSIILIQQHFYALNISLYSPWDPGREERQLTPTEAHTSPRGCIIICCCIILRDMNTAGHRGPTTAAIFLGWCPCGQTTFFFASGITSLPL